MENVLATHSKGWMKTEKLTKNKLSCAATLTFFISVLDSTEI